MCRRRYRVRDDEAASDCLRCWQPLESDGEVEDRVTKLLSHVFMSEFSLESSAPCTAQSNVPTFKLILSGNADTSPLSISNAFDPHHTPRWASFHYSSNGFPAASSLAPAGLTEPRCHQCHPSAKARPRDSGGSQHENRDNHPEQRLHRPFSNDLTMVRRC